MVVIGEVELSDSRLRHNRRGDAGRLSRETQEKRIEPPA